MRKQMIIVAAIMAVLCLASSASDAGGTTGNFAVYGWVYPVSSYKGWKDSMPSAGSKSTQDRASRSMLEHTHYPFEASSDPATYALHQQQALHRALDDGWQLVSMDASGRMLIYHPKRIVYAEGRRGIGPND